ncbi:MAG: SDR family oxidoreductase [bacterium]|nr:SDR family oxidoreductase [bacterium]
MKINGKVALVAGGSSGIGYGVATAMARQGAAHIILLARGRAKLEAAAEKLRDGGTAVTIFPVDLGKSEAVQVIVQQIRNTVGIPDIIVNSSGAGSLCSIAAADDANIIQHIESTCYAAFFLTRAFVNEMIQRNSGSLVFVGSPAVNVNLSSPAYIASRSAVRGLAKSIRYDLSNTNINVLYTEPTLVHDTDYFSAEPDAMKKFPLLFRDPRFRFLHQSSASAGEMIVKAIIRNRCYKGHWASSMMRLTGTPLLPILEWFFKKTSLPPEEDGPLFPTGGG